MYVRICKNQMRVCWYMRSCCLHSCIHIQNIVICSQAQGHMPPAQGNSITHRQRYHRWRLPLYSQCCVCFLLGLCPCYIMQCGVEELRNVDLRSVSNETLIYMGFNRTVAENMYFPQHVLIDQLHFNSLVVWGSRRFQPPLMIVLFLMVFPCTLEISYRFVVRWC